MAEATPDPVAQAADQTVADLDLNKLLLEPDEPAEATKEEKPAAETVEGDAKDEGEKAAEEEKPAEKEEEKPAEEEPKEEKPAPGTPDKAVQKLQQDLAAATRTMESMQAKLDAGKPLTAKEEEKVEKSQRKLESIRAALKAKGKDIDLLDPGLSEAMAETLVETDDTIAALKKRLDAQEAEIGNLRKANEAAAAASTWDSAKSQYPGVDVDDVWKNALSDAMELTGVDEQTASGNPAMYQVLKNAASKLFHGRATAAVKSIAARKTAVANNGKTTPKPAVTPGGAKVTKASGVPDPGPLSDDELQMKALRALVIDEG